MWIEDCYNAIKLRIVQFYQYTDNTFNPLLSPFTPAVSSGDFQDNTKDKTLKTTNTLVSVFLLSLFLQQTNNKNVSMKL